MAGAQRRSQGRGTSQSAFEGPGSLLFWGPNVKASWTILEEGQGYRNPHLQSMAFLRMLGRVLFGDVSGVRAAGQA